MQLNRWSEKQPWEIDPVDQAILDREHFPEQEVWKYSVKYILITLLSRIFHRKMSKRDIADFYYNAKLMCENLTHGDAEQCQSYLRGLERMWPKLERQLEDPGFYKFACNFALNSAFMLPYFSVLSPHATALEAARGYSVDMAGVYRKIDQQDDPQAFGFVVGERTFRSFNFRTSHHQNVMMNLTQDMITSGMGKARIFFCGGGLLPTLRYYNLRPEQLRSFFEEIVVCDKDPNMPEYLKMVFDQPPAAYGIDYHFEDVEHLSFDPRYKNHFDFVDCTGVMSYCQNDEETLEMLETLKRFLKPGGIMMFDRQVMTPDMIRCAITLTWKTEPPLKPDLTVKGNIKRTRRLAKQAGLIVEDCTVDEYNSLPALVDYTLRKPLP